MKANPYYITGVYKGFRAGEGPEAVPDIVDRVHKQRLNSNHFIVKFLSKDSPKPTGRTVYFNNGTLSYKAASPTSPKSTDTELAKQLSFLTIVDALNSQRDRFGPYGSNLEAMVLKNGTFKIALIDNGGIADSSVTASLKYFTGAYGNGVTRFEKEIFNKVLALDDFIQKGIRSPLVPYASVAELKKALGHEASPNETGAFAKPASCASSHAFLFNSLKSRWDVRFRSFSAGLKTVAAYMRQFQGNKNAFFE